MKILRSCALATLLALAVAAGPSRADNWSITLATPDQVVAIGATATYAGTITNTTGAPLALDAGLDFSTSPELDQFEIDFADELLAIDLIIPTSGYSGPIFKVTWLNGAVAGSYGAGEMVLSSDSPADPLTLTAAFTLGSPGVGAFCNIGTGFTGRGTSVASDDSTGRPAIAYNDPTAGTLAYAAFDGAIWTTTPIASGIGGQASPSLAMDLDLHPHVAYYDAVLGNLMHAWNPGTGWQNEIVESTNDVGAEPSLRVDGAGDLHISYYDVTNGDLRYARRSGVVWSAGLVDGAANVGHYSSVTADENQVPYISYYDATTQDLKFAYKPGASWLTEVVDGAGARGSWTSIQKNGSTIAISYRDATPLSPALRFVSGTPGSWTSEVVDNLGDPGLGTSLDLNGFGQPRIAYVDSITSTVRFATKVGPAWTKQDVTSDGQAQVSLSRSDVDEPYLSYVDQSSGEVRFASLTTCATTAVSSASKGGGGLLVLQGNRPNPFSLNTTFVFALARAATVRVRVFDPAGRLVAEPFAGPVGAGTREVTWNGTGRGGARLAPGRYLYEVRSGGEVKVGRLVLLR